MKIKSDFFLSVAGERRKKAFFTGWRASDKIDIFRSLFYLKKMGKQSVLRQKAFF